MHLVHSACQQPACVCITLGECFSNMMFLLLPLQYRSCFVLVLEWTQSPYKFNRHLNVRSTRFALVSLCKCNVLESQVWKTPGVSVGSSCLP